MAKKQAKKKAAKKQSKEQLTLAVLSRARQLIAKPGGWNNEWVAIDKSGSWVSPCSPDARSFCAAGAVQRGVFDLGASSLAEGKALKALRNALGGNIAAFNDKQTSKRPVIAALDKAIAKLEAQQ
jgi:hypothetical protein